MRRNLVGKKLPQQLTLRGTQSVIEDHSDLSAAAVEEGHAFVTAGWLPSSGTDTTWVDTTWWTDVTPAVTVEEDDLVAVTFVDTLHSSGKEIAFTTINEEDRENLQYVEAADQTITSTIDNTGGSTDLVYGFPNFPSSTKHGRFRLKAQVTGEVRLELNADGNFYDVPLETVGIGFGAEAGIAVGDGLYALPYYKNSTSYTILSGVRVKPGASITFEKIYFDEDSGNTNIDADVIFNFKPRGLAAVDSVTGQVEFPTPIAVNLAQPRQFDSNDGTTWATLDAGGMSTASYSAVYKASDLGVDLANLKLYVGSFSTVSAKNVVTFPTSSWNTWQLAFVREGQLRRTSCCAIIGTGGTFDGVLEIDAGLSDQKYRDDDFDWYPVDTYDYDIKSNGFTVDSFGIYMGAVAYVANSNLTGYNYVSPPNAYYPFGESFIDGLRPSVVADVYEMQAGNVSPVAPFGGGYTKGLWKQEAWISLYNPDVDTVANPSFMNADHWQYASGAWSFFS